MKKISIQTISKKILADVYTPVGTYLRLRDRFRDTVLMESTDFHTSDNSYSFIGINAIAGIEIRDTRTIEFKLPSQEAEMISIGDPANVPQQLWDFMQRFDVIKANKPVDAAQGLFGYAAYDAVQFFDTIKLSTDYTNSTDYTFRNQDNILVNEKTAIPLMRYRLYQYVIIFNHFKDELFICENKIAGIESELPLIESLIRNRDVPVFPFTSTGNETSNLTDGEYIEMVKKGIENCLRGNVFQIVLSRRFEQPYRGDEFNVYRALRSINPSPYLFYFDYGDYRLMGSSPESQLIVKEGKAVVHPIAGTFKRTGNDEHDKAMAVKLEKDEKENAEHVMLVDLARNDLSRMCTEVKVTEYKKINYYSHVIHLVSEVQGNVKAETNPFKLLAVSFPAGTLSGAPKFKAMQLIDSIEPTPRSYYGGAIGSIGFDGSCNHAIMIRTFLAKNNTLICQAGAGIVSVSDPQSELQEVNNKLNALKQAIVMAASLIDN